MLGSPYVRFRLAKDLFGQRDYRTAATVLEPLMAEAIAEPALCHGVGDAREIVHYGRRISAAFSDEGNDDPFRAIVGIIGFRRPFSEITEAGGGVEKRRQGCALRSQPGSV